MALPRTFVIDDSDAVRETLAIVLGHACEVRGLPVAECSESFPAPDGHPDLIIANGDQVPPAVAQSIAAAGVPVIWLRARPEFSAPAFSSRSPSVVLSARFDGHVILGHVRDLLTRVPRSPIAPTQGPRKVVYPYVPAEAARIAEEAATNRLPVLISGEPGTGRARVTVGIHAWRATGRLVALTASGCTRAALDGIAPTSNDITLAIDDVAAADPAGQALLLEIAENDGLLTRDGWLAIRLITATAADLGTLSARGDFSPDLYYCLNALPIVLTPLRDRPQDIAPLVKLVAADLCSALGCRPVAFTPRAMQRLTRYLWFGNTAELEAVLARSIALARKEVLDIGDLVFGFGPLTGVAPAPPGVAAEEPRVALASSAVDLIINELAHEFKNPLVTLKTFSQHLDRLVQEEASRDQLILMTGDAVDRMDRALENLLQFTRFHDPVARPVALGALLGPVLAELGPTLSERRLLLDYRPAPSGTTVNVDGEQLAYALDNLLRALVRGIADGASLTVSADAHGQISIRWSAGSGRGLGKLSALLSEREGDAAPLLPLGLALARSLVERNGGELHIEDGPTGASVTMRLPGEEGLGRVAHDERPSTASDR